MAVVKLAAVERLTPVALVVLVAADREEQVLRQVPEVQEQRAKEMTAALVLEQLSLVAVAAAVLLL